MASGEASKEIVYRFDPGKANAKQLEFFNSRVPYTCYGGAKGGGKTWALRVKAAGGALENDGIRILIIRAHYPDLELNHIRPLKSMLLPLECATYNGQTHIMTFTNGSVIKFGHWSGEESEKEYNGQEYDWIFIDEATQFSERAFRFLGGCLRGTNNIPKRMYLTCNPGGVGHFWVKRLFVDGNYERSDDPELDENPADYKFIFATAEDNTVMLENSPNYLKNISAMPNARAYRYGDWDAAVGNYFKEFKKSVHTFQPFQIPDHWPIYRSIDYGLDMLACMWWAVDEDGRCWCIRSFEKTDLNVQNAAAKILENTLPSENALVTYAPPDIWSRSKESGKTMADIFSLSGVPLVRTDNNRVQGHMILRNMLSPMPLTDPYVKSLFPDGKAPPTLPQIMFFDSVGRVLKDIESIQADEKNPDDCAKQPHEITHTVDAVRYFCISRTMAAESQNAQAEAIDYDDEDEDYESYMTGGDISMAYVAY